MKTQIPKSEKNPLVPTRQVPLGENKHLIIDPETASWAVLDNKSYEDYTNWEDNQKKEQDLPILYNAGLARKYGEENPRIKALLNKQSSSLLFVLHLTDACNLRCKYCYAGAGNCSTKLAPEQIYSLIDNLCKDSTFKTYHLEFHGGEPLLEFKIIQKIIDYLKNKKLNVKYSMQTNGTLVTQKIAQYLKKENIGVGVSIDGPEIIHDKVRTTPVGGSYKQVMRGFQNLRDAGLKPGIITVVTKKTIEEKDAYIKFLIENHIGAVKLNPLFPLRRGETLKEQIPSPNEYYDFMTYIFEYFHKYNKTAKHKVKIVNLIKLMENINSWSRRYRCLNSPCGAGTNMLALGTDGKVYACEEFVGLKNYQVGDYKTPLKKIINSKVSKELNEHYVNNYAPCKDCTWKHLCCGGCPSKKVATYDTFKTNNAFCEYYKKIFPYLIEKMHSENWHIQGEKNG